MVRLGLFLKVFGNLAFQQQLAWSENTFDVWSPLITTLYSSPPVESGSEQMLLGVEQVVGWPHVYVGPGM